MKFTFLYRAQFLKFGLISGVLVGLSYCFTFLGPLAYVGFIPLFHSWIKSKPKQNMLSGYIFGLAYNLISNYWIASNSGAPKEIALLSLILAILYLSTFWAFAGFIVGYYNSKQNVFIMLPFLLVCLEWVRSFGPLGFAWGNISLTQIFFLPLLQHIDIGGTYIVTFWIVSINTLIYVHFFIKKLTVKKQTFVFCLVILYILSGWWKMNSYEPINYSDTVNVAIIQPNIDPNKKWNKISRKRTHQVMDSLHSEAIKLNPDIILFPETALPTYIRLNKKVRDLLQNRVDSSRIPILIGTVDRRFSPEGGKNFFNSSIYFQPGKNISVYDKIHLVPFAEYDLVPEVLHPLINLNINIDRGVFRGGNEYKIFNLDSIKFSGLICYESSFPRYARKLSNMGANFLMIQANDGWLGKSRGPYQHFNHSILRAIENRIAIARSSNTGISGVLLPNGKVARKIALNEKSVFNYNIPFDKSRSFYSCFGDVFATICFIIFLFIGPVASCVKL